MYGRLKILEQFLIQLFQAAITDATHADLFYLAWRLSHLPKLKMLGEVITFILYHLSTLLSLPTAWQSHFKLCVTLQFERDNP